MVTIGFWFYLAISSFGLGIGGKPAMKLDDEPPATGETPAKDDDKAALEAQGFTFGDEDDGEPMKAETGVDEKAAMEMRNAYEKRKLAKAGVFLDGDGKEDEEEVQAAKAATLPELSKDAEKRRIAARAGVTFDDTEFDEPLAEKAATNAFDEESRRNRLEAERKRLEANGLTFGDEEAKDDDLTQAKNQGGSVLIEEGEALPDDRDGDDLQQITQNDQTLVAIEQSEDNGGQEELQRPGNAELEKVAAQVAAEEEEAKKALNEIYVVGEGEEYDESKLKAKSSSKGGDEEGSTLAFQAIERAKIAKSTGLQFAEEEYDEYLPPILGKDKAEREKADANKGPAVVEGEATVPAFG